MTHTLRTRFFLFFAFCLLSLLPMAASAATFTVTNLSDSGSGSLRSAIASAASGDTINFASGLTGTISLGSTLTISNGITIDGGYEISVSGGGSGSDFSVFTITGGTSSSPVSLNGLAIYKGYVVNSNGGDGGGVYNTGTAILTDCYFVDDSVSYLGGGVFNQGTITVTNCGFVYNAATLGGGFDNYGVATLTNCTFTGNVAIDGGAIHSQGNRTTLLNDILYGDSGGEIYGRFGPVSASYSDIQGGFAGTGNINADPSFISAPRNLNLQPDSPCIGAGTSSGAPATDYFGVARESPPSMGAFSRGTIVVNTTSDADNGSLNLNSPNSTTLREATSYANSHSGAKIMFDPTVFATPQTITETLGTLTLSAPTIIQGPAAGVAISGGGSSSVFTVTGGTNSSPVAFSNMIIENGSRGGISNTGALTLTDCTLTGNKAMYGSGGGLSNSGTVTLTNCAITNNKAGLVINGSGGGLENEGEAALIDCVFSGNSATSFGGGLDNLNGTATLTNCTFADNSSTYYGGGLFNESNSTASFINCTFAGNSAPTGGGLDNYGTVSLTNDILYGDNGGEITNNASASASYSDIQGGFAGTGNINADPRFVSAPSNLHLQPGSPCIDAGTASGAPTTDITGLTRPTPPSIGAYDVAIGSVATATTVTSSQNSSGSGQSVTFTATIVNASTSTPISSGSVTFGTPLGNEGPFAFNSNGQATFTVSNLPAGSDAITAAYTPIANSLYAASNAPAIQQNVVALSLSVPSNALPGTVISATVTAIPSSYTGPVTITSSDPKAALPTSPVTLSNGTATFSVTFNTTGTQTITATDASNTAIAVTSNTVTVEVPTITVTNLNDSGTGSLRSAVASAASGDTIVFQSGLSGTIMLGSTLTISNGITIDGGGQITVSGGGSGSDFSVFTITGAPVTLSGLTIENGHVVHSNNGYGGGIYTTGTVTLTHCTLTDNAAAFGGGLFNYGGTATLIDCVLIRNSASSYGGGLVTLDGTATLTNCTLTGNRAVFGGGGFNQGNLTLTNCTFAGNSTPSAGGGLGNDGTVSLTNDILYGDNGGEITNNASASASYSDIQGGFAGTGNINADPRFVSAPSNLHLQPGSPCIDAGTASGAPTTDITGLTRPTPPSIGAYDVSPGSVATAVALTSSADPSAVGQSVTVTATVTHSGTPVTSGSVTFSTSSGSQGPFTLNSSGQASLTLASPPATDSITAAYTPVTNTPYAASTAPALQQTVVSLSLSTPANATAGTPVSVTVAASSGSYTGPVTITSSDPKAALPASPVTLSNGSATFSVTFGTTGNQTVTATDASNTAITAVSNSVAVAAGSPTASSQTAAVPFNTPTSLRLSGSDPQGEALTYNVTSGPANGTLSGMAPSLTYTPNTGFQGTDSFTFTVTDTSGLTSAPATLTLKVAAGTPTASSQSVTTNENAAASITLSGSDPDNPALGLTYAIASGPANGTLSGTAPNITYTPNPGYYGSDSFTFTVSNGTNTSSAATVSLTVSRVLATVTGVSTSWGKDTAALTAGASLLPAGRSVDVPWLGIKSFTVTLSSPEALTAADVTVTGMKVASYGPVTISGSGTSYTITLAKPISAVDIVSLSIGNAGITSFTGSLPVLPGDVNGDGNVNASDLTLVRNMFQNRIAKTLYGDLNGEGTVNFSDYILTGKHIGTKLP